MLNTAGKFIKPIIDRNTRIATMTDEEKINMIKSRYNLTHGKGIRKKKKRK